MRRRKTREEGEEAAKRRRGERRKAKASRLEALPELPLLQVLSALDGRDLMAVGLASRTLCGMVLEERFMPRPSVEGEGEEVAEEGDSKAEVEADVETEAGTGADARGGFRVLLWESLVRRNLKLGEHLLVERRSQQHRQRFRSMVPWKDLWLRWRPLAGGPAGQSGGADVDVDGDGLGVMQWRDARGVHAVDLTPQEDVQHASSGVGVRGSLFPNVYLHRSALVDDGEHEWTYIFGGADAYFNLSAELWRARTITSTHLPSFAPGDGVAFCMEKMPSRANPSAVPIPDARGVRSRTRTVQAAQMHRNQALPEGVAAPAMVAVGSVLLVFGGLAMAGEFCSTLWCYSTRGRFWTLLRAGSSVVHNIPGPDHHRAAHAGNRELASAAMSVSEPASAPAVAAPSVAPGTAPSVTRGHGSSFDRGAEDSDDGEDDGNGDDHNSDDQDSDDDDDVETNSNDDGSRGSAGGPPARWGHSMCVHRSRLFLFGGSAPSRAFNDLWSCDVSAVVDNADDPAALNDLRLSWVRHAFSADMPKPNGRGGHAAAVQGSRMYIHGGNNIGASFSDLWVMDLDALCDVLDPEQDDVGSGGGGGGNGHSCERPVCAWVRLDSNDDSQDGHGRSRPQPRIGHCLLPYGTGLLLYGGRDFHTGVFFDQCWFYDIKRDRWRIIDQPNRPAPRTGHAPIVHSRGVAFIGGMVQLREDRPPEVFAALEDLALF